MSAPAGWHLQPDGRERYWDGSQWTEEFRMPLAPDPTAPPPAPSWASGQGTEGAPGAAADADSTAVDDGPPPSDRTQALDVSRTQSMPAAPPPTGYGAPAPPAFPAQQDYAYPSGGGGLGPGGPPATGYGAPGGQWQAPQRGGSGVAKGCVFAALGVLLLLVIALVAVIFFVSRTVDQVTDTLPTAVPTSLPSGLPTDLPTTLPTEGLGESITITVGEGFQLPRAQVQDGWSLDPQGAGAVRVVNVSGMRATLSGEQSFPVLFTLSFPASGGGTVETVCTAPAGSAGASVDVSCVPLFGDVSDARQGRVTAAL
jgi:hypothetical protein